MPPRKQQEQTRQVHDHAIHERSVRRQLRARDKWQARDEEKEESD